MRTNKGPELSRISGRPFDEFNCFHIRDFEDGDCLRVRTGSGELVRGIVSLVDFECNTVRYRTATGDSALAIIDEIVSLEEYVPNWLA